MLDHEYHVAKPMMHFFRVLLVMGGLVMCCTQLGAERPAEMPKQDVPDTFPRFIVPGHERQMQSLRELFYLHYKPAGPLSTLWDQWMSQSSLWPAVEGKSLEMRRRWGEALSARRIDDEGYVSTHQHPGLGHPEGWPFPLWSQGGGVGWHFSVKEMPYGQELGIRTVSNNGFTLQGGEDGGIDEEGWKIRLTQAHATLQTPAFSITPDNGSYLKIQWQVNGEADAAGANAFVEWTTDDHPEFAPDRRMYFSLPRDERFTHTIVPLYRSPMWKGTITGLRINFEQTAGTTMVIRYLATAFDTRHNVNNANLIQGCCNCFNWTGDMEFLRANIQRMRLAARFIVRELGTGEHHCVVTTWPGHDGRTGVVRDADGNKTLLPGRGIGNNYWDLLPFGAHDALATIYAYDAFRKLAALESAIARHPEWNIPADRFNQTPEFLARHADEIKRSAGQRFWNAQTGRFVAAIDADGAAHDYGFTFVNCEAIAYGFATAEQAESIVSWLSGDRIVEGDTSQGADIYHWRFGPRSTTRRNIDWYGWYWSAPETIPWGGQVQDGGAVLGFSYHDLISRLHTRGPEDAWRRLEQIIEWFDEVQAAGGYREYYKDGTRGTLQGGGPPGGLGMDREFFESILVPQIMIYGFLGLEPRADGIELNPRLPPGWPELTVTRIALHDVVLDITASRDRIEVRCEGNPQKALRIIVPDWNQTIELKEGLNIIRKGGS